MKQLQPTNQYKKDLKRYRHHPKLLSELKVLLDLLINEQPIPEEYPNISPYAHCAWNPVVLVDPDGREIGDYYDKQGNYLGWDGYED